MKKLFLVMAAIVALSLVSCNKNDYKTKGEQMAKQLDELCQQQDTAAVLELEKGIRDLEKEIAATGDSTAIADFRAALKDARQRNAGYITKLKVQSGADKEETVKEVVNDALEGNVDIQAVSSSIDSLLQVQSEQKKQK